MTSFHEGLPPLATAIGSRGGPERRTEVVTLGSGREERNTPWAHGRRRYDIGGALATLDDLQALQTFFEARRGRLQAFRFRDFADWKSCPPLQDVVPTDQPLGTGDGAATTFQLVKVYGEAEDAYVRPIRKPVAGAVRVAVNGLETGAISVSHSDGLVTFASTPPEGAVLTAGFHFDTPVRFDTDRLDVTLEAIGAGRAAAVPLVEVLV
ncbi:MAG: DUF2460 domain-containing protein [Hyphomonadaceae bacterium]|nr:MAG: hypothetical protein FD160_2823 [Caulobacteraceae bacterium]MBT9446541.1 DUF2460 domain-containing protein [Hyphomonadaceae bacterium]TPW05385.1 MAG: hypothetical protein FD124_2189 [Alphaproteobacteria bacterium]